MSSDVTNNVETELLDNAPMAKRSVSHPKETQFGKSEAHGIGSHEGELEQQKNPHSTNIAVLNFASSVDWT